MEQNELEKRAALIVMELSPVKPEEALRVLLRAAEVVVSRISSSDDANPAASILRRRVSGGCRVTRDQEIEAFILRSDRYLTLKSLRTLLVERFGETRTPSVSSLHRYIQKITQGEKNGATS